MSPLPQGRELKYDLGEPRPLLSASPLPQGRELKSEVEGARLHGVGRPSRRGVN